MSKHHINLNGNIYDTRTGKIIQKAVSPPDVVQRPSIDGFQRPKSSSQARPHQPQHAKKPLGKSQTLMRHAVDKPTKQSTEALKPTSNASKPIFNIKRFERAQKTPKSSLIQKFQNRANEQPLPAPKVPTKESTAIESIQPAPTNQPLKNLTPKPQKKSLAEAALERANAHEQPEHAISKWASIKQRLSTMPRSVTFGTAGLIGIAVLSVGWYLSLPNISMQLAANRSGIDATIPSYQPSGYQLNRSIEYEPGKIQLHYNTLTDNRSFSIKKAKTDRTSEHLRQYVTEHTDTHQAINHKGKTIFVYGNGNAMWIDGGIHYTIQGAYSLNSDQLIRLVESL